MSERQRKAARDYHFIHGEAGRTGKQPTPEYRAWRAMIDRCYLTNHKVYKNHGARGIRVCERWRHSFPNFLADMGRKPSPELTLDRFPNNDGNYEPGNCRWASRKQQIANSRQRQKLTHCKRGHEFTVANTYITKIGRRRCRTCLHDWYIARKSEAD